MRLVFFLQKNCLQAQNISVSELDGIGISHMYSYFVVKISTSGSTALDSNGSVWGVVSSMLRVVALRKALDVLQLFIYWSTSAFTQTEWKGVPILKNLAWAWRSIQWSRLIRWELFNVENRIFLWAFNKTRWCSKTSMIRLLAGERQHGFQIWLNVPKVHKADDPMCHDGKGYWMTKNSKNAK